METDKYINPEIHEIQSDKASLKVIFQKHEECEDIINRLRDNKIIATIDFSINSLLQDGAQKIAKILSEDTVITSLRMSINAIKDQGAIAIANALKTNSTLSSLDLSSNGISDVGASAIAEALCDNNKLSVLDLSGNAICDTGATSIANALTKNRTLKSLYLGYNYISNVSASAFINAFHQNTTITTIGLGPFPVNQGRLSIIQSLLMRNMIITAKECDMHLDSSFKKYHETRSEDLDALKSLYVSINLQLKELKGVNYPMASVRFQKIETMKRLVNANIAILEGNYDKALHVLRSVNKSSPLYESAQYKLFQLMHGYLFADTARVPVTYHSLTIFKQKIIKTMDKQHPLRNECIKAMHNVKI